MQCFSQLLYTFGKYLILWPLHTCAVMTMPLEGMDFQFFHGLTLNVMSLVEQIHLMYWESVSKHGFYFLPLIS